MVSGRSSTQVRAVVALAMLLPFLTVQLAWLPLGMLGGKSREVAAWSNCGQDLCVCAPEPECGLCPSDSLACALKAETKTDRSPARELQVTLASLLSGLVAIPDARVTSIVDADAHRLEPVVQVERVMESRSLETSTPPPWA